MNKGPHEGRNYAKEGLYEGTHGSGGGGDLCPSSAVRTSHLKKRDKSSPSSPTTSPYTGAEGGREGGREEEAGGERGGTRGGAIRREGLPRKG